RNRPRLSGALLRLAHWSVTSDSPIHAVWQQGRRMTEGYTTKTSAVGAPRAEAFPDWPNGWYELARSDQLGRKRLEIDLFGRRLLCYRTTSGQPVVMDARCWHMGADLSEGSVIGDQIACPFHGWRYGPSGQCESVPAQADPLHCAIQQTYCATERSGR